MSRVLLRFSLLGLLVAALAVLSLEYIFVVREISVRGNDGIAAEFVISASGLEPGMGMLRLSSDAVKNGISALGTHAFEGMERLWPDGVRLAVRPRVCTAMAICDGGVAVLDGECVVMEVCAEAPDRDLIYISGIGLQDARIGQQLPMDDGRLERCTRLLGAIEACGADAYVSEIDLSDARELRLVLRGGCTAVLEPGEEMQQEIAWLKALAQDMEHRSVSSGMLQLGRAGTAVFIPAGE